MDYQIFFALPGDEYNAEWMDAEDEDGCALEPKLCKDKRVKLCLFPAISQHQSTLAELDENDVTAAFACNKRFTFLRKVGEEIDPEAVVAKAVVLMERSYPQPDAIVERE